MNSTPECPNCQADIRILPEDVFSLYQGYELEYICEICKTENLISMTTYFDVKEIKNEN